MSVQKNSLCEGEVEGLGSGAEGIVKIEGTTAFVPFCLTGERIAFKALKVKDNIAYGKLEKVLTPSPRRAEPQCPLFKRCGGCDLQHMDYPAQLDFKRNEVLREMEKLGGIKGVEVSPTVPCESPYRYRNKLAIPIGVDEKGQTVLGFYARRSHRIVPADDCLIQAEWAKDAIFAVKEFARERGLSGYDEFTFKGELRKLVVREVKGNFIVALVVTRDIDVFPLAQKLKGIFGRFTLLLNINSSRGNAIFSNEWRLCHGEGKFCAEEMGIKYFAGAETFLQVNDGVRGKLYGAVLKEAEGGVAVDLYSGGGLLTAMLAKKCKKAYGVEVVKEASQCADELCAENGLQGKMINICGKVEDVLDVLLSKAEGSVIVCDPPRKGMESSVCRKLKECSADKIVLISCNPATLARDLGIITSDSPFKIVSVTPFDMFPQTRHVETVAVLSRKTEL